MPFARHATADRRLVAYHRLRSFPVTVATILSAAAILSTTAVSAVTESVATESASAAATAAAATSCILLMPLVDLALIDLALIVDFSLPPPPPRVGAGPPLAARRRLRWRCAHFGPARNLPRARAGPAAWPRRMAGWPALHGPRQVMLMDPRTRVACGPLLHADQHCCMACPDVPSSMRRATRAVRPSLAPPRGTSSACMVPQLECVKS